MPGRIKIIFFFLVGAMAAKCGVHGFIQTEIIDLWSDYVTEKPLAIEEYYEKYMKNTEKDMEGLIMKNPALERLMSKARGLLQMRLLQWVDVIGQMALIDQRLSKYVKKTQDPYPELLLDYAQWTVSHDHTSVTGLVEEMRKLVMPLFTSQSVLQLAFKFMTQNIYETEGTDASTSSHTKLKIYN